MPKNDKFFKSRNAYRIAATLFACCLNDETEILLPDLARITKVHYSVVLYWINTFETHGCVRTTRYGNRLNSICKDHPHVVIHLTNPCTLCKLYGGTHTDEWEKEFCNDINATPQLSIVRAA